MAAGNQDTQLNPFIQVVDRDSEVHVRAAHSVLFRMDYEGRVGVVTHDSEDREHFRSLFVHEDVVLDENRHVVTTNPAAAQALLLAKAVADEAAISGPEVSNAVMVTLLDAGEPAVGELKNYAHAVDQHREAELALLHEESLAEDSTELLPEFAERVTQSLLNISGRAAAWAEYVEKCAGKAKEALGAFHAYLESNAAGVRDQAELDYATWVGRQAAERVERAARSIPAPPGFTPGSPVPSKTTGRHM